MRVLEGDRYTDGCVSRRASSASRRRRYASGREDGTLGMRERGLLCVRLLVDCCFDVVFVAGVDDVGGEDDVDVVTQFGVCQPNFVSEAVWEVTLFFGLRAFDEYSV